MSSEDISIINKVVHQDSEIIKQLDPTYRDAEKTYRVLKQRLDLYTEAQKLPISSIAMLYFNSARSTVLTEAMVAAARKDFDEQTSQIISRLDSIENEIKIIKEKLNVLNP